MTRSRGRRRASRRCDQCLRGIAPLRQAEGGQDQRRRQAPDRAPPAGTLPNTRSRGDEVEAVTYPVRSSAVVTASSFTVISRTSATVDRPTGRSSERKRHAHVPESRHRSTAPSAGARRLPPAALPAVARTAAQFRERPRSGDAARSAVGCTSAVGGAGETGAGTRLACERA